MFTISYSCAVIVPVVSGLVWDATGVPAMAFVPIALGRPPHHRLRPDAPPPQPRAVRGCDRWANLRRPHDRQPQGNLKETPVTDTASRITAESFLTRLAERGIDYVMANAGTDFAPIIEALSRNPGSNRKYPRVITVPHENVAVAMAHGYYRVSGKPAAVMVHVTVGTANAICGLMNAARDNAPILLGAGRTPAHRGRPPGLAQPLDPLGPGDVRPGRPRPRVREVGLRAARRAVGRVRWSTARSTSR